MFLSESSLATIGWKGFERAVSRLLLHEGYADIRIVGQANDKGADILAHKLAKRWLVQVKFWKAKVGLKVVDETTTALTEYGAEIPVIACLNGFDDQVTRAQRQLQSQGIPLQLWDRRALCERALQLPDKTLPFKAKPYQDLPIKVIVDSIESGFTRKGLVVMATGLGKTVVAAEALRRVAAQRSLRVLVLAHTNALVYQLDRAFWPFLRPSQDTQVWNEFETPSAEAMEGSSFVFGCINSVYAALGKAETLPEFDLVLIDECHHAGASMYAEVVSLLRAGSKAGPYLLGLTATPWQPDGNDLDKIFGESLVSIDLVTGLRNGFLSQIDYRLYVDNIRWEELRKLSGKRLTPRGINRRIFISEWDDAVVLELKKAWNEVHHPRAIVFCGTIDHAITMRDRINALSFTNAQAIYSGTRGGRVQSSFERNRILSDFHDGRIGVVCAVDIFNEGVDVPDVNIVVFQRVTHSRRIFVQQLGRGLRVAEGKSKVIVLDFVSDIRRFAAGLKLKDDLGKPSGELTAGPVHVKLNNRVTFRRVGEEDAKSENFLREWLEDIAAIEAAEEDASVLKFVPALDEERR